MTRVAKADGDADFGFPFELRTEKRVPGTEHEMNHDLTTNSGALTVL